MFLGALHIVTISEQQARYPIQIFILLIGLLHRRLLMRRRFPLERLTISSSWVNKMRRRAEQAVTQQLLGNFCRRESLNKKGESKGKDKKVVV